jgi:hypothetical protein
MWVKKVNEPSNAGGKRFLVKNQILIQKQANE